MAAYNFKPRFIGPIRAGIKWTTIRPEGRRRHARPGERIQLYTGMRTKACQKLLADDPRCLWVKKLKVTATKDRIDFEWEGKPIFATKTTRHYFAVNEGCASFAEWRKVFLEIYGEGTHRMLLIAWTTPEPSTQTKRNQ